MAKAESCPRNSVERLNVDFMRSLVKQYSELGQWTSAFFWADAAAASSGSDVASGDDIWLLASTMLAKGELHRAAHAITSRALHVNHLLCLGVAMRAYITAKEPATALTLLDECYPALLEPTNMNQTHNRALAGVLVWQAKALALQERRDAAIEALTSALRADVACYEALDLLLEQHALTPSQESDLIESLPINNQLSAAEAALLRVAYRERLLRYAPLRNPPDNDNNQSRTAVDIARSRSVTGAEARGRRLAASGDWAEALKALDEAGPWACADVRAACLVELKKSSELFAFAHCLVDSYPQVWTSWYAVGCYYYLIGKNELARRYLSKACSLSESAGCVWLAYGHSFAADSEHDQAMAAYFKASQLMPGSYLPLLYVGVECCLLNNMNMCEGFMTKAAILHSNADTGTDVVDESDIENLGRWERVTRVVGSALIAHEAGVAAFAANDLEAARTLWLRALHAAGPGKEQSPIWAATLDCLGHVTRRLGRPAEALRWHERALALRPAKANSIAARGLCLALLGRETEAADALHSALAKDPDNVVAIALLDAIVDRLDAALTEEEIPQFPFPAVNIPPTPTPGETSLPQTPHDATNLSDMKEEIPQFPFPAVNIPPTPTPGETSLPQTPHDATNLSDMKEEIPQFPFPAVNIPPTPTPGETSLPQTPHDATNLSDMKEEIPQFPFPAVNIPPTPTPGETSLPQTPHDATNLSDMKEEIPQFPFPAVNIPPTPTPGETSLPQTPHDATNLSDMKEEIPQFPFPAVNIPPTPTPGETSLPQTPHDATNLSDMKEEIPQFPFPAVNIPPTPTPGETSLPQTPHDATNLSDMSMSFD
ncbi:unnamed protein product [Pieris brassicae]|uniref:Uncharacterized protein n=1 Tax=Pieris brassicae TaxID=7116 RepID=A0A9P0X023_PIEBR|nr:unnamed protein product [Pieris brassicae]